MFITNSVILGCNLEISAFMFRFGSVAKHSLAYFEIIQANIQQLSQRCPRKKLSLNFS